jgi:hypothetical protein
LLHKIREPKKLEVLAISKQLLNVTTVSHTGYISQFDCPSREPNNTASIFVGNSYDWFDIIGITIPYPYLNKKERLATYLRQTAGLDAMGIYTMDVGMNGRYIHEIRIYTRPLSKTEMSIVHAEMRAFWS